MCGKSGTSVPRVLTNSSPGVLTLPVYGAVWCFDLLTLRQANMGYEKYSLHLIFTFYLNRDASVLELFPVVVFQ